MTTYYKGNNIGLNYDASAGTWSFSNLPQDFIDPNDKSTGWCVDGSYGVCTCPDAAFPEILTGRELWFNPSEVEIKKAMRYYYENRYKIDRQAGIKRAKQFSYESVGEQIQEFLNA